MIIFHRPFLFLLKKYFRWDTHCPNGIYKMSKRGRSNMKKRDIQADILALLSDGRLWKMKDIACEIEVSRKTVIRHIQSLSYRYNILVFHGGEQKGGVRLIKEKEVSVENLSAEELNQIILCLKSMKDKSKQIDLFIFRLNKILEIVIMDNKEKIHAS